jgi:hypothetical protein
MEVKVLVPIATECPLIPDAVSGVFLFKATLLTPLG